MPSVAESIAKGDLHSLIEHMLDGFAYCEAHFENGELADFTYLDVNPAFERLTGLKDVVGKRVTAVIPGIREAAPELFEIYGRVVMSGRPEKYETYLPQLDRWFAISVFRPAPGHFAAAFDNVTERKRADESMRIAAATFEVQDAILVTDASETILRVNRAFETTTGYTTAEVVGRTPRILSSGWHDPDFYRGLWADLLATGKWSGEIMDRRKNGETYPKFMTITAVYDEHQRLTHYVAVFRDMSAVKKTEHEVYQLAYYDPLTELPNRRLLLDRLEHAMATCARTENYGALIFLDVDHFKKINDTRGHAVGDLMLIEVARRLKRRLREGDSVARLGGDEFVILLEELSQDEQMAATQAEIVAEKIREDLAQPYLIKDTEHQVSASLGVALFRAHEQTVEEIFKQADVAMYQAKAAGRDGVRFFDPEMQTALDVRAALEADLRHALDWRQFRLHYQVQVDRHYRPLGAEVLLRWAHPERGMVSPTQFIPLAEETGMIERIGAWVLAQACMQLAAWQDNPAMRHLRLAVNVSARQFHQPDFAAQVEHILKRSGAPATQLELELTESLVVKNVEDTIAKMRQLKKLGVKFSLDDFGTGYSSLAYLKRLPLDQIKIDQSFVRDLDHDPNDAAIVETIIAMTLAMGLDVIAEGVETETQRRFLEAAGCQVCQGFLFGEPVPVGEFAELLQRSVQDVAGHELHWPLRTAG